jgi:hypothetical protein
MSETATQPFARGAVLALVLVGAGLFLGLLWYLGHVGPPANNGGGHGAGRGLNGYAAMAALAEADGFAVSRTRSKTALDQPGVLVLTPLPDTDGKTIADIVDKRRHIGPTIVISPKWVAMPLERKLDKPRGWTRLTGATLPQWSGFADDVTVTLNNGQDRPNQAYRAGGWRLADGRHGPLPDDGMVESGTGAALVPLVTSGDGRTLAAFRDDNGRYPALDALAGVATPPLPDDAHAADDADEDADADVSSDGPDMTRQPLILVFEPDLFDNYGLRNRQTALLALSLLRAAARESGSRQITFDLSLAGLGGRPNLLTLAFEPPFLAATLGLILALLAVGWRAFCRFGPPRVGLVAIPPGKTTLVVNSAGLIRRAGRLHLVSGPYADALRERLAARLGLRRGAPAKHTDALIDAHLERIAPDAMPFSQAVAHLTSARKAPDAVRAAQTLHALEKDLA